MPVSTTFPAEGDALDAADLNGQFTSLETAVNALEPEDVQREALRRDHLPTTVDDVFLTAVTRGGLQALGKASPTQDVYGNALVLNYAGGPPNITSAGWQTFSSNASDGASASAAPYGPYSSGADTGWRIPADDGDIAYAAERRLASPYWDPDSAAGDHGVDLLLCHFGVNVIDSAQATGTYPNEDPTNTTITAGDGTLWLAIGWEDDQGTRHIVERTIRAFPVEAVIRGDASITGTVRGDDVPAGRTLVAVFGAICAQHLGGYAWNGNLSGVATDVTIDYYHFNYEPVRGEEIA